MEVVFVVVACLAALVLAFWLEGYIERTDSKSRSRELHPAGSRCPDCHQDRRRSPQRLPFPLYAAVVRRAREREEASLRRRHDLARTGRRVLRPAGRGLHG